VRRLSVVLLTSLAALVGCADPADEDGATGVPQSAEPTGDLASGGGIAQADNDLQVTVDRGDGSAPEEWTLTCAGFVEGSHPEAEDACAHLAGLDEPFAALPDDLSCTQQFGGPQTAHVIGRWGGEPVDVRLARSDGCLIAQWDALGPLLPVPVG
jgi:hypothetical protein